MKAEWKSVWAICGVLCVMIPGELLMPLWYAESWDTPLKVIAHGSDLEPCFIYNAFTSTDVVAFSSAHFGRGAGPIYGGSVDCSGTESNLIDCLNNFFFGCFRGHSEDAGVRCQGK